MAWTWTTTTLAPLLEKLQLQGGGRGGAERSPLLPPSNSALTVATRAGGKEGPAAATVLDASSANLSTNLNQREVANPLGQLSEDLMAVVFAHCDHATLLACAAVNSSWRRWLRRRPEVFGLAFSRAWGLSGVTGKPRGPAFFGQPAPPFAVRHALRRGDTLTSLAVAFGTTPAHISRINLLSSEHALSSRAVIYVPVPASGLAGQRVAIRFCGDAQREIAVVVDADGGDGDIGGEQAESPRSLLVRERGRARMEQRLLSQALALPKIII